MTKKLAFKTAVFIFLWLGALFLSFGGLWWYKTRPGEADLTLSDWPKRAGFALSSKPMTLVMFVHPKCDCSEASLHELQYIMQNAGDRVGAIIDFYFPEGATEDWAHSPLWKKSSALPATSVIQDKGGKFAYVFGAKTSGETYLFDSKGKLLFHGGITQSRGHIGESTGRRAIASIVKGEKPQGSVTRTFGCALFSAKEYAALVKALGPVSGGRD